LIHYSELLSENHDEKLETLFIQLENHFLQYVSANDKSVIYASGVVKLDQTSFAEIYAKYLKGYLLDLIRFLRTKLNRDLRLFLRNIIRFHFKNMNDESDSDHLFLNRSLFKDRFTIKTIIYDEYRYHRTATEYY
jgi:hypothetical protein